MLDFIFLGAHKAATSWIFSCIQEHPEICIPVKDTHFFSRENAFSKGIDFYLSNFNKCSPGSVKGEISTSYLYSEIATKRIQQVFPNVKYLVILRDPIERALSHFNNDIKSGRVSGNMTFEEALKLNPSYILNGKYKKYLEVIFQKFEQDKLRIIFYDDIITSPEDVLTEVFSFIGVDAEFKSTYSSEKINVARIPRSFLLDKFWTVIAHFISKVGLRNILWTLKKNGVTEFLRKLNTKKTPPIKTINMSTRLELMDIFSEDVGWVQKTTGRDLSGWLK
jgi:hypothetical protein